MSTQLKQTYNADAIRVIEGLDHVRHRPGMYIGSTGSRGLHHLVWEVVDNAIDEATNGFADEVTVVLNKDNSITVIDNGRGIPVGIHKDKKLPAVRLVFEVLGAGGKFDNNSYKTSGGLHGVGASVVNALSKWLRVNVKTEGKEYVLEYKDAKLVQDLTLVGETKQSGTTISFLPDDSVFKGIAYNPKTLRDRLRELAFLNSGVKVNFIDNIEDKVDSFSYDGGIVEFVDYLNNTKDAAHSKVIHVTGEKNGVIVDVAMQYTKHYSHNVHSFVNNINTIEGGTHETGFRQALTRCINEFLKNDKRKRGKKDLSVQGSDTTEGLTAVLSVKMPDTEFEGQTKTKLGNPEVRGIVHSIFYDALMEFLTENSSAAKQIIGKIMESYEGRVKAEEARKLARKKDKLSAGTLSVNKIASCSSRNPKERELFIVEGDSAGGSAKQGRNRKTQAILPLRGKPLNVEKRSIKDLLENDEYANLISAIGGSIGKDFNADDINYHKVIIATDADVDGAHIRVLLVTFFYRYMRPLIEKGNLFIAQPPLYKISDGKKTEYAYDDRALEKIRGKFSKKSTVQRYKGLGEMNPGQLWETTMNPKNRTLIKVTLEDAAMSDALISTLMGSKVQPRREFIEENM